MYYVNKPKRAREKKRGGSTMQTQPKRAREKRKRKKRKKV